MGETIKWKCKCGYTKEIDEGFGWIEYEIDPEKEKVCTISALCSNCSEVIAINEDDKHLTCTKCEKSNIIAYSNPCLYKIDTEKIQKKKDKEKEAIEEINDDENELKDIDEWFEKNFDKKNIDEKKEEADLDLNEVKIEDENDKENEDDYFDIEAMLEGNDLDDNDADDEEPVDGNYYLCPKCNQFLMERFHAGLWD